MITYLVRRLNPEAIKGRLTLAPFEDVSYKQIKTLVKSVKQWLGACVEFGCSEFGGEGPDVHGWPKASKFYGPLESPFKRRPDRGPTWAIRCTPHQWLNLQEVGEGGFPWHMISTPSQAHQSCTHDKHMTLTETCADLVQNCMLT